MKSEMLNCYRCGGDMHVRNATFNGEYAGREFPVTTEGLVCGSCGFKTLHASQVDDFKTKVADAYRVAERLLTSADIRKIRTHLGMSQEEFANYLNVGLASVKRWELGKAQDKSMDELIRIKCDLARAEQNVKDVLFSSGECSEYTGKRPFSFAKLGNLILFFLEKAAEKRRIVGALHINKLCWYADAWNYARAGVSITGARYARLPLGPVVDDYRLIYRELQRQSYIDARKIDAFKALREFNAREFSTDELQSMQDVWNSFGPKLGSIIDASHEEDAWKKTEHADLISFKLAKSLKNIGKSRKAI